MNRSVDRSCYVVQIETSGQRGHWGFSGRGAGFSAGGDNELHVQCQLPMPDGYSRFLGRIPPIHVHYIILQSADRRVGCSSFLRR